jgi:hypothetical protein
MQDHKQAYAGKQYEKRHPEMAIRYDRFYSVTDLQWNLSEKES